MTKARMREYEAGLHDTDTFTYFNINPEGKITSDCSTRTLALALGIPYSAAIDLQCLAAKDTHIGLCDGDLIAHILERHGFTKMKVSTPYAGMKRETAGQMAERLAKGNTVVVMRLANHFTVAKEHTVHDIWNCTKKTVYRYWVGTLKR